MRPLGFAIVLAVCSSPFLSSSPKLTGGTGTIYVGSYAKRMVVIDEATERVTAEIPLVTGIPWSAHRSQDAHALLHSERRSGAFRGRRHRDPQVDRLLHAQRGQQESTGAGLRGRSSTPHHDARDADHDQAGRPVRDRRADIHPIRLEGPQGHPHAPVVDRSASPAYFSLAIRYSPDGKLLYVFSDEILILDATSLQQVGDLGSVALE